MTADVLASGALHGADRQENCPACGGDAVSLFYEVRKVPTNSCLLFDTREEAAACPTGDVRLGACAACGFIYNTAFDPSRTEYSGRYEETQGFSPTFSRFHRELAARLIERHDLGGKRVLEIGCGKGEFLLLLSQMAQVTGVGVDPSARQDRIEGVDGCERVTLVPEYYSEAHGAADADMVVCKMTLEHIPAVEAFLRVIRRSLEGREDTRVFFQIPEALRILRTCAFEDIYYEHCSYFTPGSLARAFRRAGFEVADLATEYDGQYLTIEAVPASQAASAPLPAEDDRAEIAALVASFPERVAAAHARWRAIVEEAAGKGRTVVLWGSGSKAVSFLTTLDAGDRVRAAVDINPHRQGSFMPVTGHEIVPPEALCDLRPDLVIVMNPVYVPEIKADLDRLGLSPEVLSL